MKYVFEELSIRRQLLIATQLGNKPGLIKKQFSTVWRCFKEHFLPGRLFIYGFSYEMTNIPLSGVSY